MSAGDSSEVVSALYTIDDALAVSSVLDLLDGRRIEELVVFICIY